MSDNVAATGGARPLRVTCLLRDQYAHIKPVEAAFGDRAEFTYDGEWDAARLVASRPDVVVCVNDYHAGVAACLDAARSARIPSLVFQDGILEWRCQYENPLFGAGGGAPQHQPVLADAIACIGAGSARQIDSWGNAGRIDVTGMPRLDYLIDRQVRPVRRPGRRLLVMTAKQAGFTDAQRAVTIQALQDVRASLAGRTDLELFWRVDPRVVAPLGIENQLGEFASTELATLIEHVDAVITTPSTAMLEVMLLGRPVAALDYHNVPRFVPSAWSISAPGQMSSVLDELLAPPATKMAFQRQCLADALRIDGPAAPRAIRLIEALYAGERLPHGLISRAPSSDDPTLADLYPDQAIYRERDVAKLQVRIARLENENARLRRDLGRRSVARRLAEFGRALLVPRATPLARSRPAGGDRPSDPRKR